MAFQSDFIIYFLEMRVCSLYKVLGFTMIFSFMSAIYFLIPYFSLLPSLVPQLVSSQMLLLLLSGHIYIYTHIIYNLNSRGEKSDLSPSLSPFLSLETASHGTPGWPQSCYLAEDVLELWSSFSAERMGGDPDNSGIIRFIATQTHSNLVLYHPRSI